MSIDLLLFSSFLALSLVLGIISSTKVHNISEYALGNRDFSTPTMIATLIATWIGSSFVSYGIIETYRRGINFLIPAAIDSFLLFFIGWIFAPRMGEFLGKISIAESMGELFGQRTRMVTVVFSLIRSIGSLAVQFKVAAKIMELIFGTSGEYATIMSAFIVITYSTLGGIRAVTFTDIIQFFTFGCVMPIITIVVWQALGESNSTMVWNTITTSPLFDYKIAFSLSNPKFYEMLAMCMLFVIPEFQPAIFQRISMGSSVGQVIKSFKIAGLLCLLVQCVAIGLTILVYSDNPNVNPDNLVQYIINHYAHYAGFKGMIAVGIMAMLMSSSDSLINSISIIFAHDLCKPLKIINNKNELLIARLASILSGLIAILIALKVSSILNLMISIHGLYLPVVSIPFIFAIFGFRSSEKSVLSAMTGALMTIFLWKTVFSDSAIDSFIPGILSSIFFLFGTHYLTNQDGGWVGIKDQRTYKAIKSKNKRFWHKIWYRIKDFNFIDFCRSYTPKKIEIFFFFGLFAIISTIITMISMRSSELFYNNIVAGCYISVFTFASYLLIYPLWPATFKKTYFYRNILVCCHLLR